VGPTPCKGGWDPAPPRGGAGAGEGAVVVRLGTGGFPAGFGVLVCGVVGAKEGGGGGEGAVLGDADERETCCLSFSETTPVRACVVAVHLPNHKRRDRTYECASLPCRKMCKRRVLWQSS
jgi:hypothetical protein